MKLKNIVIKVAPLLLVLFVDLFTKAMFQGMSHNNIDSVTVIPNFLEFYYVENTGASFGMLKGQQWFLIVFTIAMLICFVVYDIIKKPESKWFMVGYALVLAGGVGNLIDRIAYGFVRDFISFSFFPTVFNIADASLVIGVILLGIYIVLDYLKQKEDNGKDSSKQ